MKIKLFSPLIERIYGMAGDMTILQFDVTEIKRHLLRTSRIRFAITTCIRVVATVLLLILILQVRCMLRLLRDGCI